MKLFQFSLDPTPSILSEFERYEVRFILPRPIIENDEEDDLTKSWNKKTRDYMASVGVDPDRGGGPQPNEPLGLNTFNIPPGITCPGASEACKESGICYGFHGNYDKLKKLPHEELKAELKKLGFSDKNAVAEAGHIHNLELTKHPEFVNIMNHELKAGKYKERGFRIHSVGDFYDHEYADKWAQIAKANPDVKFLAYTRSWSTPKNKTNTHPDVVNLKNSLKRMEKGPKNLTLRYSVDWSMPDRPEHYGFDSKRNSYLHGTHDAPDIKENGCKKQWNKGASCHTCMKCFNKKSPKQVTFAIHPIDAAVLASGAVGMHYSTHLHQLHEYLKQHPETQERLTHPDHPLHKHAQFVMEHLHSDLPADIHIPDELKEAPGIVSTFRKTKIATGH